MTTEVPFHMKFGKIKFGFDEVLNCCGMRAFYAFDTQSLFTYNGARRTSDIFDTQEEQYRDLIQRMNAAVESETEEYNSDGYDDEAVDCAIGCTVLALEGNQYPGLVDALKADGWEVSNEFVNPRTDNRIFHMSKVWV